MNQLLETSVDYAQAFHDYWKQTTELPTLGIAVLDHDGCCLFANRTFRRMHFHDTEFDPAGATIDSLEGDEFFAEVQSHILSVISTGQAAMIRFTRYGVRLESVLSPWKPSSSDIEPALVISFTQECRETPVGDIDIPVFESDFNSWGELDHLTNRQLEVLAVLRQGMSQREIAELLGIATKTVETHRDQLVHRLGLRSTIDAIRLADRAGLTLENARLPRHRARPWQEIREQKSAEATDRQSKTG